MIYSDKLSKSKLIDFIQIILTIKIDGIRIKKKIRLFISELLH
jgi:hypothetical protein